MTEKVECNYCFNALARGVFQRAWTKRGGVNRLETFHFCKDTQCKRLFFAGNKSAVPSIRTTGLD